MTTYPTLVALAALPLITTACATTGTGRKSSEPPPETTEATAEAGEPSAVEVEPGVFIPCKMGYVVLLKDHGTELLDWMNVPRHKPSPENLDDLNSSLFNAACYATPEGSWPWDRLCRHSMLACTGGDLKSASCNDEAYIRCLAENRTAAAQRVVLLKHWEVVRLPDSECMLPCACEGGAVTLDKQERDGYRVSGSGCVNAFTCSFVCPDDAGLTQRTVSSP